MQPHNVQGIFIFCPVSSPSRGLGKGQPIAVGTII